MKKLLMLLALFSVGCQRGGPVPMQPTASTVSSQALQRQSAQSQLQDRSVTSLQKFNQADQNQDRFLSLDEVVAGGMSFEEASRLIQRLDFDQDQKMSFSEFYVSSWGPGAAANDVTPPPAFIAADQNQDMFLSVEELATGDVSFEMASQILQSIDLDRDQKMSLGEFLNTSWGPGPFYYFQ